MRHFLQTYGTVVALAGLVLVLSIAADGFLDINNFVIILKNVSFLTLLALGFTCALMVAELDLSFAGIASLCSVLTAALLFNGYPVAVGIGACLLLGTAAGFTNGLLVTRYKIPSLIATLAVSIIARGVSFMITGGIAYVGQLPADFVFLGRGKIFGLPVLIIWVAIAVALLLFLFKSTKLGAHLTGTGESEDAARLAGIPVKHMKTLGLTLSGLFAAFGGLLITANLSSSNADIADGFLMQGFAAALLGMTMIEPGKANILGTLVGAVMIGVLANGLTLLGAQYYYQDIVLGLIIIASVSVSASFMTRAAFGGTV